MAETHKARGGFRKTESDIILVQSRNGFERKMEVQVSIVHVD